MNFLSCGDCNACCSGALGGSAYGISFGNGAACAFLCDRKCSIYQSRPDVCQSYQCAWSQNLFIESLKPNVSNLLISVEQDANKKQYLKIIPLNKSISQDSIDYINDWVKRHNTYCQIAGDFDEIKHRFGIN